MGDSNRWSGHATGTAGDAIEVKTTDGLKLLATGRGKITTAGAPTVDVFIRPEFIRVQRDLDTCTSAE